MQPDVFRCGIQPTANKLYQLVRKDTMSTLAQAVSNFWIELRVKSRMAIEHPGLPENVRDVAGAAIILKKSHENTNQLAEEIRGLKNELLEANKKILVDTQILANQNKTILELKKDKAKLEVYLKTSQVNHKSSL